MLGVLTLLSTLPQAVAQAEDLMTPTEEQIARIREAAPDQAPATPARPRKVLVWGHMYTHLPNPFAAEAFKALGEKTGAYEAVVSDDPALLLLDKLSAFDGLVMNNIHEPEPFLPRNFGDLPQAERAKTQEQAAAVRESILSFVRDGKGIIGVHAGTAALQGWAEYGELMGGFYTGHITEEVPIKLDDAAHPINACFEGKGFRIHDEIYFVSEPHPRTKYRVLLSLDLSQMADPGSRPDKDYGISWVREYGEGRMFYCSLGHFPETYWHPLFLKHLLAGIQFALGDLRADATPNG